MQTAWLNKEKCIQLAGVLKSFAMHPEFLNRPFIKEPLDQELRLRMILFSAAICHQTHLLKSELLQLAGWEYMEQVFLRIANENPHFLDPHFVTKQSTPDVNEFLLSGFSVDGKPGNSTLDRVEERTALYLDTAQFISKEYSGRVKDMLKETGGYLLRGGNGLYEVLEEMDAFSDPHRKKSTFFIKLVIDSGLLKIKDEENLLPIMDYHMQRVLLRNGCVEVPDADLREMLLVRVPLKTDEPIRSVCIEALKIIAQYSGHPVMAMNDIFWPLGRSCCHERCLCEYDTCEKQPCTLTKTLLIMQHNHCIFEECCKGSQDKNYRNLWHPMVSTHYY